MVANEKEGMFGFASNDPDAAVQFEKFLEAARGEICAVLRIFFPLVTVTVHAFV